MRIADLRAFCGDQNVAAHGQFKSAGDGHPVQATNDRFGIITERLKNLGYGIEEITVFRPLL